MWYNLFVKITGIIVGIISVIFPFGKSTDVVYQAPVQVASTTIQTQIATSTSTAPTQPKATTTPAKTALTTKPLTTTTQNTAVVTPPVKTDTSAMFEQINTDARAALVNILCTTQASGPFSSISGSGVVVSSDGVILTNAHVAQYFLLKDFNGQKDFVQCVIRTGSPAYSTYNAELVYISPTWVETNSKVLVENDPTGTGEHDYAFLKIVSKTDGSAIGQPIPYIPINLDEDLQKGDNILLASYPAGFLGGISIEKNLYQTSAITQISDAFTFEKNTIDVISIPGTVVSQRGSSGGATVDDLDKLVGIITTSSDASTTGARDLRAITTAYINRDLNAEANTNLQYLISHADEVATTFNKTIAGTLTKILTDSILGN